MLAAKIEGYEVKKVEASVQRAQKRLCKRKGEERVRTVRSRGAEAAKTDKDAIPNSLQLNSLCAYSFGT